MFGIGAGVHGDDTGCCFSFAFIDAFDAGMGVFAAYKYRMQHTW